MNSCLSAEGNISHVYRLPGRFQVDVVRVVVLLRRIVTSPDVEVVRAAHGAQEVAELQRPSLQHGTCEWNQWMHLHSSQMTYQPSF